MWVDDLSVVLGGRAIGWLDGAHDFPRGTVSPIFFERLGELASDPFEPFTAGGWHDCTVCQFAEARDGRNLFVPSGGFLYVAPVLIVHYIAAHSYTPPTEFVRAVEACPDTRSMEYKKLFLANGGRALLRPPA